LAALGVLCAISPRLRDAADRFQLALVRQPFRERHDVEGLILFG